ncbi:MAG: FAD-dependent oxidoreductase [Phycisphaerales bacterium]|nr:FAD-dependent oxidoreductase [Phycisphaerales bacterium]
MKLPANCVFVEAESFATRGGWWVDQQSFDQVGSSYLLAHGMGKPVKNAVGKVAVPAGGTYTVWVRTRDWAAWFGAKGSPGKFKLSVNDKDLATTFGTVGENWHWQSGGTVKLAKGDTTLTLKDLTGFAGRCDAILLTTDAKFTPPNDLLNLTALRRKALGFETPKDGGTFDLVVVGGGIAGTTSALSAARLGLKVALVQDRPVLGGNNSSEVRVHLQGLIFQKPYEKLGAVTNELGPRGVGNAKPANKYYDDLKLALARSEANLTLFLSQRGTGVETTKADDQITITAVIASNIYTGERTRIVGKLFADCTGDGCVGYLAGGDFRHGRESKAETGEKLAPTKADRVTMGASCQWYSKTTKTAQSFPALKDLPWALQFTTKTGRVCHGGEWFWESGIGRDHITETEQIRDYSFRAIYGNWAFIKHHPNAKIRKQYAKRELEWVACIAGKRESRRLLGDVILKQQDIHGDKMKLFPDACVTTTWSIDLHYPKKGHRYYFPNWPFLSEAHHLRIKPYPIPYRTLYSRNVGNLFMAGRCISVTHVALGTIRVMRTGGMMGEVVGMAAKIAVDENTTPRGVYQDHLPALKAAMTKGIPSAVEIKEDANEN